MHPLHTAQLDDLFERNTFLPDSTPDRFYRLLDQISQDRYTTLAALYAEAYRLFPGTSGLDEFFASTANLILLPVAQRRAIINESVFQIWARRVCNLTREVLDGLRHDLSPLQSSLRELPDILQRISNAASEHPYTHRPPIQRFDIDPLIAGVLAPCYDFPQDAATRQRLEDSGYSIHFFSDVVNVALSRIAMTWPGCHEQFRHLVKLICYLPDGTFRQGSAPRYGGTILLSAKDHSLLDVEESLVRESAHQLLYYIEEISPLIDPRISAQRLYFLPWSNRPCDLAEYFQGFFAQLMRAKYLERVRQRPASEMQRAEEHLVFSLRGLGRALPELAGSRDFTPHGRILLDNLAEDVRAMERQHASLLLRASRPRDLSLAG
ncbi:aKG-HExxH-type peptide beta-hydroxylase [Pseudomonas gingeri]|uniref:aKG-HExxH-type peptide beta-hydroxylase n=1 Tax=Pseudomonas gingeri TaxID=117681 RepID=UPI0015A2D812|nr:HEXXH motif-containing putative peptide modification protein [Pseudomonas gingeri]NVZ99481.1 HEXXH motif domain-containing protein [Pseudomonas gingeri]NWA15497.1 HEXXH motif domain-containing protein [Pseudomonas gingeri]NWA56724.1 HEXXH motif domain-containing protein [Pseudomonas gingeri]NWA95218.1 HEXXH motif domain-containing protein [Pseudomonas gingeri]NWB05300.1 HEXXH motif domain-containing protein [Pseudomonas gingeri]